jgi:hypothetical protein
MSYANANSPQERERMRQTVLAKYTSEHIEARERVVSAAVQAGKIPQERADHYRRLYDASPSECERVLGSLVAALAPSAPLLPEPTREEINRALLPELTRPAHPRITISSV